MKYNIAIGGVLFGIIVVLVTLVARLGGRIVIRWDGLADSLPLLGLFVLFLIGQLILTPRRRRRR